MTTVERIQRRINNEQEGGFKRLSAHSESYRHRYFFIFLGADPELSYPFLTPADSPEAIALNRKLVLTLLQNLCLRFDKMRERADAYRLWWAEATWLFNQLWPHVPNEVRRQIMRQIMIDQQVNETDPDFSFYKAAFGEEPQPLPSL